MRPFFIVSFLSAVCLIQNDALGQQVLSTSGSSFKVNNLSMSWTIGEPVVSTVTASDFALTQGFHQSDFIVTSVEAQSAVYYDVYPNPARESLTISSREGDGAFTYSITDVNGIEVLRGFEERSTVTIGLQMLPPGIYFLMLVNSSQRQSVHKISKTH